MLKEACADFENELHFSKIPIVRPMLNIAYCHVKLHNYRQAIEHYTKVLSIDPQNQVAKKNINISIGKLKSIQKMYLFIEIPN